MDLFQFDPRGPAIDLEGSGLGRSCCPRLYCPGLLAIESTDGADIYYVEGTVTDQPGPLMRQPVKGGPAVKVLDDVIATSFEVLDKGIYYLERVAGDAQIRYFDFGTRASTIVAREPR